MPPDFGFVANHPALDFCNTVGAWVGGAPERDKLARYPDLVAWARGARLLSPAEAAALRPPQDGARLLARARAFRSALYRLITAALAGRRPDPTDLGTAEHELGRARAAQRLAPVPGGYAATWVDPADPERPLLEAVRAATGLLEAPLDRIHRCAGEGCGWLFRDTSRAGRRRWCSMTTCGNTAKVRRFRGRER